MVLCRSTLTAFRDMPSINQNLRAWDNDWGHDGSKWSLAWGSDASMWRHTVHARIGRFLPCANLLEIGPGRGRLTEFLLPLCESYLGVDLAYTCVKACRARFPSAKHARFTTTSGTELFAAGSASIDFAVSWESLVHADQSVLSSYLSELARVLRPGASAFLHHSNLGAFIGKDGELEVENPHWRDPGVSAESVAELCKQHGLHVNVQECLQWAVPYYSDCFTLLRRPKDPTEPTPGIRRISHIDMNGEMRVARQVTEGYWFTNR
ncbi:MAG: hypothetical protein CMJ88_13815 [Planctomycetes bacterium]|nr:hypothetical protein [Planctomycetota bacterium]